MLKWQTVLLLRKEFEEALEILRLELLRRRELPQDRPEMGTKFRQPLRQEFLHGFTGFGQNLAVGDEAAGLQREDEILRHFRCPPGKGLRFLRRVVGAVDLDRPQFLARKFELALLRQSVGIERALPGLERPTADTNTDLSGFRHPILLMAANSSRI
ncbi:hypothetical protein D3C86_1640670 [compost metagenome]